MHKEWVVKALNAGKHVLVEKPVALSYEDYLEMREAAFRNGKYLQDASMFIYFPRLDGFLACVRDVENFGLIEKINAIYTVGSDASLAGHGVRRDCLGNPLGCLGDLGWYCLRVGLVLFCKYQGLSVVSAKVLYHNVDKNGIPTDLSCIVTFEKGRTLHFHCSYKETRRQKVEAIGERRIATMSDFFVPRLGINSFQVKERKEMIKEGVHSIETMDFVSGMSPNLMMWRHFARISQGIDEAVRDDEIEHGWGNSRVSREANEISSISLETQRVADALMESIKSGEQKEVFLSSCDPRLLVRGDFLEENCDVSSPMRS